MMKLDVKSLKNLCLSNQEYRNFCQRTDLWKRLLMRDYPEDFKSMPVYLNQPDWMRVYFWFKKKNILKEKLGIGQSEGDPLYERTIFTSESDILGMNQQDMYGFLIDNNVSSNNRYFKFNGLYIEKYPYSVLFYINYVDEIKLSVRIDKKSKLYDRFVNELLRYIFMTTPKTYDYKYGKYWSHSDDLFLNEIPNYAYNNRFEYLYIPNLTIDEEIIDDNIIKNYIYKIFHPLIKGSTNKQYDINYDVYEFFELISNCRQAKMRNFRQIKDFEKTTDCIYGNFRGCPFIICNLDGKLKLLAPASDIQPLLDKIYKVIEEH